MNIRLTALFGVQRFIFDSLHNQSPPTHELQLVRLAQHNNIITLINTTATPYNVNNSS